MLEWIKNDFRRVYWSWKYTTKDKMPTWLIVVWYVALAPIGIILYPLVKLITLIVMKLYIKRLIKKLEAEYDFKEEA